MSKEVKNKEVLNDEKVEMKWENLTEIYIDTTKIIGSFGKMLANIDMTYGELIKKDDEITAEYIGSTKLVEEFSTEIVTILSSHSTTKKVENKLHYIPFKGVVDGNDDKAVETYVNIVVAYDGFADRIQKVMEQTGSHLLGKINALQAKEVKNGK